MKKIIVILFSAALGISFLFIGFGSYLGQSYVLKVGKNKVTESEFLRELDTYKANNELTNLSDQEEIYHRIQFINQYINDLLFTNYLAQKTFINEDSKKIILKKSLNNDEMFRNLDETTLQNYLKEITNGIDKDLFNNSLEPINLVDFPVNEDLLKIKEINIYEILDTN
ncbi:MAG: SurA N-terminal domain-containing protein, partial [Pelagibacteraceae bacterium]